MPSVISSPNMGLSIPVVGVEPGPQYATDVNNSLTILDSHNHSIGSGVQITPSGLNINSLLLMNGNILGTIGNLQFQPQLSSSVTTSLYAIGVDLYYNDGSGNVVRITQSGSVAGASGTITGLPSGTASASYGSGTFTFQAATNTAADIDGASFIFRNSTVSSDGITLSPPNALASNYQLFLPLIPAQTDVMTLDTSGNMGTITYDQVGQDMTSVGADAIAVSMSTTGANSIANKITASGANNILNVFTTISAAQADIVGVSMSSTGANAISNTRTRASGSPTEGVGGIAVSSSSGSFTTSSTSPVGVLSVTLSTSGRPVFIGLMGVGAGGSQLGSVTSAASTSSSFRILRGGSMISGVFISTGVLVPPSSLNVLDFPSAGTYTYTLQALVTSGAQQAAVLNSVLIAYEL